MKVGSNTPDMSEVCGLMEYILHYFADLIIFCAVICFVTRSGWWEVGNKDDGIPGMSVKVPEPL